MDVVTDEEPVSIRESILLGPLEEQAGFMLRLAQLSAFERFFARLGPQAARISEITVLVAIERNPGIRQGEIADVLLIKWPNMTKLVRGLEDRGLVERHVPPHDRRSVVLRVTDEGRKAIAAAVPAMQRADREAFSMLGDEEHEQLLALSRKIAGWRPAVTQEYPRD